MLLCGSIGSFRGTQLGELFSAVSPFEPFKKNLWIEPSPFDDLRLVIVSISETLILVS